MDATIGMLQIARAQETRSPLVVGLAEMLPFSDAAFDCVSDITVVQHLPYELQSRALKEMIRVLTPGGRLILMELIRGRDPRIGTDSHVFPREPQGWISEIERNGGSLIEWFGQEFLFADRLFAHLAQTLFGRNNNLVRTVQSAYRSASSDSFAHSVYWSLRHVTVLLSVWAEFAATKLSPASLATHGIFVFRKKR
jgi:ubiquinone/menaquinone biosynthesis C-methylase UbiE